MGNTNIQETNNKTWAIQTYKKPIKHGQYKHTRNQLNMGNTNIQETNN